MTMVNGPIGGAPRRASGRILERGMRCLRLPRSRGQAIVETALLLPILMLLTMGSADLGRVFYYSIEITNAAREGARQGTYFDPISISNSYDSSGQILSAVKAEAPDLSLSIPATPPCMAPSSWSSYYPVAANTGYVYICFDGDPTRTSAQSTINVTILYTFQPVTPLAQVVGASTVQLASSITMQVQHQQ